MGVANYGQMTAGGWMYIGPQGIVHGTFNTILNAGRKYLGVPEQGDLTGHTFVSSGLGGMSGAPPKAANIANAVGIFAEVDYSRIVTRHDQGWVDVIMDDIDEIFKLANEKLAAKESISIAYHGNIVDLLEAAAEKNFKIDLLSDQTSCHNVYNGGYCPVGMTFEERTEQGVSGECTAEWRKDLRYDSRSPRYTSERLRLILRLWIYLFFPILFLGIYEGLQEYRLKKAA